MGGLFGTIPTDSGSNAKGQWTLGPEVILGVAKKWGTFGVILNHNWDILGNTQVETNVTGGSYWYAFSLGGGYQIAAGPGFSYNHEADSSDAWTLPIGTGLGMTKIINGRPWKFTMQYWYYVERPDAFGPQHVIRFTITPVMEMPWSK